MAAKRGGGQEIGLELRSGDLADTDDPARVLQLSEAIDRLAEDNGELAELLELSAFVGLSNPEIADLHETTVRTVQRKLLRAKAWVHHLLSD
jgi:DNA-directed RNA polymerase specialized sigma24 family protein